MGSSRFPNKVMQPIGKYNSLEWIISRLKISSLKFRIVIATTISPSDDEIEIFCAKNNIECFRGSENDVMHRLIEAERELEIFGDILEITGDCPFICPFIIESLYMEYRSKGYDYVSNCITRTWPDGFDVQIYRSGLLRKAYGCIKDEAHKSHGGWNIVNHSGTLRIFIGNFPALAGYYYPKWGLTLDTKEDLIFLSELVKVITPEWDSLNIINYIKSNPELLDINKEIKRKVPGDG